MNAEGKIIIKLSEFKEGFFLRNRVLIALFENDTLEVCQINEAITDEELKLLEQDLETGLQKIRHKIRKGGPIARIKELKNGVVYYDDLMIMKNENGIITCHVV